MTLDAMTQVTQAEAQAKSSMQDASTASKQIIADADAKGKAYQAEKEAQAAAAVKEMMRNAEAKAAAERSSAICSFSPFRLAICSSTVKGGCCALPDIFTRPYNKNDPTWSASLRGVSGSVIHIIFDFSGKYNSFLMRIFIYMDCVFFFSSP